MTTVTMSHWPARALTPLLATTVGGVLRAAAWRGPDPGALVGPRRGGGAPCVGRGGGGDFGWRGGGGGGGRAGAPPRVRAGRAGRGLGRERPGLGAARVRRRD